jgi:hypothetical protein
MKELKILGKSHLIPTNDNELFTYNDEVMIPKFKAYCEWAVHSFTVPLIWIIISSFLWITLVYPSIGFEKTLLSILVVYFYTINAQLNGIAREIK